LLLVFCISMSTMEMVRSVLNFSVTFYDVQMGCKAILAFWISFLCTMM
jgi:hypothetical protein